METSDTRTSGIHPRGGNWQQLYGPGVRRRLDYGGATLVDLFERAAQGLPRQDCYDFMGASRRYEQVADDVAHVAHGLAALGVRAGDRVAILLPTCPENLVATLACARLGAQVVQHNPLYTADELAPMFADHGATVAIVWNKALGSVAELRADSALQHVISVDLTRSLPTLKRLALRLPLPAARAARARLTDSARHRDVLDWRGVRSPDPLPAEHPRPGPDDVAVILYTSGTSGSPKGVPLTHANLVANCLQGVEWAQLEFGRNVFLAALPMFHALGLTVGVFAGIAGGSTVLLVPTPDPALMVDACKRRLPTFITGVPPMFEAILREANKLGIDLRGIHSGLSGAMALDPEFVDRWEAATGGHLIEGYGLTETAPIVLGNPIAPTRRPGTVGVPFPDTDIRIVDPEHPESDVEPGTQGELLVRGPQVFGGYLHLPEETAAVFVDGWFRTGDLARLDDDFVVITGRAKELIVTGGFNVSPAEVEEVLRRHPAIGDVSVVGMPRAHGGEDVVAAVIPVGTLPSTEELRAWAKHSLAAYKVPRRFEVVAELPTNAMGKVLRREVAALLHRPDQRPERP